MRILHLSDLHFVEDDHSPRIESGNAGPIGNGQLMRNFDRLRGELISADIVVISGDVTDSGTRAQWSAFTEAVDGYPGLAEKVLLVPGNHDLNYVGSILRTDTADFYWRSLRNAHFDEVARGLAGAPVCDPPERISRIDVDDLFPSVRLEKSVEGATVAIVAINTVSPSITFGGNAVGRFLTGQTTAVVRRLQHERHPVVVVGHHHPLPFFDAATAPRSFLGRIRSVLQGAGMESVDGFRFLEELQAAVNQPILYLHGHKHIYRSHVDSVSGNRVCGAPSLLFGDESTGDSSCLAVRHMVTVENGRPVFASSVVPARGGT